MGYRTNRRCAQAARPLDLWWAGQSYRIFRRGKQPGGYQRNVPAAVRQLHHVVEDDLRRELRVHLRLGDTKLVDTAQPDRQSAAALRQPDGTNWRRHPLLGRFAGQRSGRLGASPAVYLAISKVSGE